MRLTQHTDYALRTLMFLALKPRGELATTQEISKAYGISENHLLKVVRRLGQEGYIETLRGRRGGIRLARAPEDINLGDFARRTEDEMRLVECFDPKTNTCPIAAVCAAPPVLDQALAAFLGVLDDHSLADLLEPREALARILQPETG